MIKVKAISVREKQELEPLLIANPDIIEEGLKIISHQQQTDSGPLDILAVDEEGTLVVVELKNEASDGHLDQGLRYYDWCYQNISWISNAFGKKFTVNADSPPRLMLIAPSFTETVKRIAKYVNAELTLVEYHAFQNEKGERGLICNRIDHGFAPEPPEIPSLEKKIAYFKSEKAKSLFKTVLVQLEKRGIEVKPIHGMWLSLWYREKRFGYIRPRKMFFIVDVLRPDGDWNYTQRVSTKKEWDKTFQKYITRYLQYLDANRQGG